MVTAAKQAVVAVTAVRTQLTGIQLRLLVNLDAITIIKLVELAIAIIAITAVTARYAIAIVIVIPVASSVVVVVLTALLVTHQQMAASSNQRTIGDYFRFHLETTTTAQPSKLIDVNTVIVVEVAVIAVIVTAIVDAAIEGIKREQQQSGYCGCCWLDLRSLRMAIAVSLIIAIIITAVRAIVVAAAAAERVAIEVITKKAAIKDCSAVAREAEIIASIDLLRITAITAIVMIIAIDTGVEAVARATAIITVVTTITTTAAAATAEEEHWNYVMITMLIAVI